jgi:hypothetical protein
MILKNFNLSKTSGHDNPHTGSALELSPDTVYRMAKAGEIPGCKLIPTGAKKKKTWRADAVIFEKWRTSPDRRKR